MSEDTDEPQVTRPSPPEEDDVAREPEDIQREIEQTRAELAETIDAIADRVSPRRAAVRGANRVRTTVQSVLSRDDGAAPDGAVGGPRALLDTGRTGGSGGFGGSGGSGGSGGEADPSTLREIAGYGSGSAYTGTQEYTTRRVLRPERVVAAVGAVAAVTALVVYLRRRR